MSSGRCDEGPRNCGAHTPLATPDTDLESGMVGDPWDGEQERVWKPDWVGGRPAGSSQPSLKSSTCSDGCLLQELSVSILRVLLDLVQCL